MQATIRVASLLADHVVIGFVIFAPLGLDLVEGSGRGTRPRSSAILGERVGLVDSARAATIRATILVEAQPRVEDGPINVVPLRVCSAVRDTRAIDPVAGQWRPAERVAAWRDAEPFTRGQVVSCRPEVLCLKGMKLAPRCRRPNPSLINSKSPLLRKPALHSDQSIVTGFPSASSQPR